MNTFNTPMMEQYKKIKEQYQDCLLFYRMGDFYELFLEDAHIGSKVLNITLTGKSNGKNSRIPMAGVPYHAVDTYLAKLVSAGYKVAICEQLSPPNKKGLVERDVVRVVTPGTILDEKVLRKKDHNHIMSFDLKNNVFALSYADVSTGFFGTYEVEYTDLLQTLRDELAKISPVECILPEKLYNNSEVLKIFVAEKGLNVYPFTDWEVYEQDAVKQIQKHFSIKSLEVFGLKAGLSVTTSSALLGYLKQTQKSSVVQIQKITKVSTDDHMVLDRASMINLELFSTIREHDPKGSLLAVLDQTITPMGGRLLKSWIKKPLLDKTHIHDRLEGVSELVENTQLRQEIGEYLSNILDIERIISRLAVTNGNARDFVNLKLTLQQILMIKKTIQNAKSKSIQNIEQNIELDLDSIITLVNTHIVDEPPIDIKSGGIIRDGLNEELDKLRKIVGGSREWIDELEREERERTGINSLKVKFNKVFGFYIEVSKSNLHLVPKEYERKQTLVNAERFSTPELKHHEEIILTAEERIHTLEYELFLQTLNKILEYTPSLQKATYGIAELDCLTNFATIAIKNNYICPTIISSGEIEIEEGRHPVVEQLLDIQQFVPNDVVLNTKHQQQLLITGPNMAGKSVFIRQVALIVLMAQIGSFVPAKSARISVVDRIFVRSGASDVITAGMSTFMVEMVETAYILHHATKNSLIVMDEIGRGTSTYDGISIAWAVMEYLITHYPIPPKTLFATHYHELQALEGLYPQKIKNFHMAVADDKGSPIFLHTILPGGASHSFGVAVAKLAGVPDEVIIKAREVLQTLENRDIEPHISEPNSVLYPKKGEYPIEKTRVIDRFIHQEIENLDISQMTPLQALNTLADLKEKIKLLEEKTVNTQAD